MFFNYENKSWLTKIGEGDHSVNNLIEFENLKFLVTLLSHSKIIKSILKIDN